MTHGMARIQEGLNSLGYGPVKVDGKPGPVTFAAWDEARAAGGLPKAPQAAIKPMVDYPDRAGMVAFYGPAGGPDCTAGSVTLPFAFPLAWDATQRVSRFACHKRLAAPLTAIFADAAKHYGETEYRRLRLDQFGGCYNYRPIRNGSSLSIHSWGAAVDLDPVNNQLSWGRDRATFARPEYEPFWRIVEATGATSLGRARNYDFQHFQFCDL